MVLVAYFAASTFMPSTTVEGRRRRPASVVEAVEGRAIMVDAATQGTILLASQNLFSDALLRSHLF